MKRYIILSAASILMMLSTHKANAYDFSATNDDGQTIYYNITSTTAPLTVEITYGNYGGYTGDIVIPDKVTYQSNTYMLTTIGEWAFENCYDLTSITIPNSVTNIREGAFADCRGLIVVTIPNSVTNIGDWAFAGCSGLIDIIVDESNPNYNSVDGVLFNKTQDTLLRYPGGKTGSYTISNMVTTIGESAFENCHGLTFITIPNSVTNIESYAFAYCYSLTSVTIPNSVTTIGSSAFKDCTNLISVTIPNSVTSIVEGTFHYCCSLTSITIPNSVTNIGAYAFDWCYGLTEMYIKAVNPPQIFEYTFYDVSKSIPVYVCGLVEDYRRAAYWSEFTNILQDNDCGVGIKDIIDRENEITFYPNPATDNINIVLPENTSRAFFMLYDMQGRMLIRKEVSNQETVPINNLASGIYIYHIKTEKENHTGKLIRK